MGGEKRERPRKLKVLFHRMKKRAQRQNRDLKINKKYFDLYPNLKSRQ